MMRRLFYKLFPLVLTVYSYFLIGFWFFQVRAENSSHPRLEISVSQGKINLETAHLTLTEDDLSFIHHFFQRQIEIAPFKAEMHLTVQGPQLDLLIENLRNKELGEEAKNQLLEEVLWNHSISISNRGSDIIFGDSFEIGPEERVGHLLVIGGSGTIRGHVDRLLAIGSHVKITETGKITRDLIQIGSQIEKEKSVDAREIKILLPLDNNVYEQIRNNLKTTSIIAFRLFLYLFIFVLGLFYITIATSHHQRSVNYIRKNFIRSWVLGFSAYILVLPIIFFLVLSIVGIMALPVFFLCYLILLLLGFISGSYYVALKIPIIGNFAPFWVLGFGLVFAFYLIWVPVIGIPLGIFITTLGFGSVLRNLFVRPELYEV